MKLITTLACMILFFTSNAQIRTESEIEKDKNRVRAYSYEEMDSIQLRFGKGVKQMFLTDEKEEEYLNIISTYVVKMGRLNDADLNYSNKEMSDRYFKLKNKLETEVKSILTDEQYKKHQNNFGSIEKSIEKRVLKIE